MSNLFTPIVEEANRWLHNHLRPDMRVFQYGSDESTVSLGNNVQLIVSVEHSLNRYNNLEISMRNVRNNSIYKYIPPENETRPFPYSHLSYGTTHKDYLYYNFKEYVNYITKYEDNFFHITIINGFSRASCIMTAANKMKKSGIIILNDSDKYEYQDAIKLFLNKHKVTHLRRGKQITSIFERLYPT